MKRIILKRIIAFIVDWIIILTLGISLFFVGPNFDSEYLIYPSIKMFSAYGVISGIIILIFLPLVKDCLFNKRSFGKYLLRLKIIDNQSKYSPKLAKLILRNILFYLPVVEFGFLILNNGITLSDMITNTSIIEQ